MRALPFGLALLLLGGCGASGNVVRLSEATYPALAEDAPVEVTTGALAAPYEELAVVVVGPGPSWLGRSDADEVAEMNEQLRAEARRIGAEAVVRVSYDVAGGHARATGTAVRVGRR